MPLTRKRTALEGALLMGRGDWNGQMCVTIPNVERPAMRLTQRIKVRQKIGEKHDRKKHFRIINPITSRPNAALQCWYREESFETRQDSVCAVRHFCSRYSLNAAKDGKSGSGTLRRKVFLHGISRCLSYSLSL